MSFSSATLNRCNFGLKLGLKDDNYSKVGHCTRLRLKNFNDPTRHNITHPKPSVYTRLVKQGERAS